MPLDLPPSWPKTQAIPWPMQKDDRPYAGSAVYWIEDDEIYEGGILDKAGPEILYVAERYTRKKCVIKTDHASLMHPEDKSGEFLGFCKMLQRDGSYKIEPCYKEDETFEQCWLRIARLQKEFKQTRI